jgi:hypothetical protein
MSNRKWIYAGLIGLVFVFAGYNLYSYFTEQAAIEAEEERLAEERRLQREAERQAAVEAEEAERAAREAEAEARRLEEERLAEERRLAREAEEEAARIEAERLRAEQEAALLAERIARARTLRRIEEVPQELIDQIAGLSSRYITDNPGEFLPQRFDGRTFGPNTRFERLIQADTNALMLFAAISPNTAQLGALMEIGLDVNSANEAGYTPLMFAAAYNTPEAVRFLIDQGADLEAWAYVQDLTPLHVADLMNPNPDVIDVLVEAGADLEAVTENPMTPLLLACSDNQNLEVAERLAGLGADTTAYSPDGLTAHGICSARVRGEGDDYIRISEEIDARILAALE